MIGAKTRERDWIEAIGATTAQPTRCRRPPPRRLHEGMEQMTQRHPDDFEAWVYAR
jgi:hypothetical protein